MGIREASLFLKIDLGLLVVALVLQILGVALPYWVTSQNTHMGLWRHCAGYNVEYNFEYKCATIKSTGLPGYLNATRAFEILGLVSLYEALVVTIVVMRVWSDRVILKVIGWILSFCAGGFILVGVIIFWTKAGSFKYFNFSGAFVLTILAGLVVLAAGVLGLLDQKRHTTSIEATPARA